MRVNNGYYLVQNDAARKTMPFPTIYKIMKVFIYPYLLCVFHKMNNIAFNIATMQQAMLQLIIKFAAA